MIWTDVVVNDRLVVVTVPFARISVGAPCTGQLTEPGAWLRSWLMTGCGSG